MLINVDWLKEYVDLDGFSVDELEEALTMGGLEVEGVESVELPDGSNTATLEVNVTPNRGYCLSHIGMAREVAALAKRKLNLPDLDAELKGAMSSSAVADKISVSVEDAVLCPRYCAMVIENVQPGPSPQWLRDRLVAIGLRPINNIVDITNFVMMEYGQPLHAFDLNLLSGARIVVRRARPRENFASLDGSQLKLETDALVIADAEKPVALAGVMGGANSQVTSETRTVVLESAYFDPATVRKASGKYGLRTDSSFRFEREVDISAVITAQSRAALLMREIAGGKICAGRIDEYPNPHKPRPIPFRVSRANKTLGMDLRADEIVGYLQALDMRVTEDQPGATYLVEPPSYRPNVTREIDLIEEVLRLHGFKNTGSSRPVASMSAVQFSPRQQDVRNVKDTLCHLGYSESVNYSFIEDTLAKEFLSAYGDGEASVIQLNNPISADMGTMRTSLIPGLLKTAARNLSKGQKPVKIFETGKVYFRDGKGKAIIEKESAAVLATGPYERDVWKDQGQSYGFYDLKGTLESLTGLMGLSGDFSPAEKPCLVSGKTAVFQVGDKTVAVIGEISAQLARRFDFDKPVFVFELDLQALTEALPETARFSPIAKFPETFRDISILVDKTVPSSAVRELVRSASGPLVGKVELFDCYEGKKMEKGKKSLTLALSFQSPERTLTDEEINPLFENVVATLKDKLGARLRE